MFVVEHGAFHGAYDGLLVVRGVQVDLGAGHRVGAISEKVRKVALLKGVFRCRPCRRFASVMLVRCKCHL